MSIPNGVGCVSTPHEQSWRIEAWDAIAPCHKEQISKSHLAECVLRTRTANVMLFGLAMRFLLVFAVFVTNVIIAIVAWYVVGALLR